MNSLTNPIMSTLIQVQGLRTQFKTVAGAINAVDGISLSIRRGETLALVGESGCGKSAAALSILRLIPEPPGRIADGQVLFHHPDEDRPIDLLKLPITEMRTIRGRHIAMVFQEPMTALNPVMRVGRQIAETVELHQGLNRRQSRAVAVEMLDRVGIADPQKRIDDYPHQFSGGMRQRVMLAIALSCKPSLLIADEPTTALDVTVQSQILTLLRELQSEFGMAILLITHDLGIVAQMADRVSVMYAGRIVESADVGTTFNRHCHPYTEQLLRSVPRVGVSQTRLNEIPGSVPHPSSFPIGCRFHPRCERTRQRARSADRRSIAIHSNALTITVLQRCTSAHDVEPGGDPELRTVEPGHEVACWEVEGFDQPPRTARER